MEINKIENGGVITLELEGRIDTVTHADLQKAILAAFQDTTDVVLDFASIEYVSSAGLRALLIGQKTASAKSGSMKLININETVLKVLSMSGFDKILNIE